MALWGSQKKFDKNGDGKLNSREWQNWYLHTYGVDLERAERRKAAQSQANWNAWFSETARITHAAVGSFLDAACELLESTQPEAKELAWKALLCQMAEALAEGKLWNGYEKANVGMFVNSRVFYPYRAAAYDLVKMSGLCSEKALEQAVLTKQSLFSAEGALTQEDCGTFWKQIIAKLPPYYDEPAPEFANGGVTLQLASTASPDTEASLRKLLETLFPLLSFFAGATEKAADQRNNRLLAFFTAHWKKLRGEHADPLTFHNGNCLNFARRYPQLRERWTREELAGMDSVAMLSKLYRVNPELAIAIWRSIAGTTQPLTDPKTAEDFLRELEPVWYDGEFDPMLLRPILTLLKTDEAFARQIFQSAYVDYFQENMIKAAYACDEPTLAEHFFELLKENPLPRRKWAESYEDFEEMMEEQAEPGKGPESVRHHKIETPEIPDDGTVYHYCKVQFPGAKRTYAYLTNGLGLKAGDQVYAPFGSQNLEMQGIVRAVEDCCRRDAPYPPERTKKLLRKINIQDS